MRDYAGNSASQSYTYTVDGPNQAPTANPQSLSTDEDTPLDIILTGSDPDCNPLTYSVVSSPSHGTLGGIAPNLTYTPTANYNGADSLTFVANDGLATSEPATVTISVMPVNDAPVADPQSIATRQDSAVAITLTGSDVDGDELTYGIVVQPDHGTLSGTAPDLTYTPAPGYGGPDSFAFIVNDGELDSEPAVVSVTIKLVTYLPAIFGTFLRDNHVSWGAAQQGRPTSVWVVGR